MIILNLSSSISYKKDPSTAWWLITCTKTTKTILIQSISDHFTSVLNLLHDTIVRCIKIPINIYVYCISVHAPSGPSKEDLHFNPCLIKHGEIPTYDLWESQNWGNSHLQAPVLTWNTPVSSITLTRKDESRNN